MASEVSSVAIKDGTKILMGQRRDNERWTLPGGHLDPGENKTDGAIREVKEEAGYVVDPKKIKHLKSKKIKTYTGLDKTIHAFVVEHDGKQKFSTKNDPDKEVKEWLWIDTKNGLPKHVKENLHSPKNVVLQSLGLSKSMEYFIADLIKSGGGTHKYLRKFRRGGEWIYVYHEGSGHGRQISEEAVGHLKKLGELGDEDARSLHSTLEAHSEEKLKVLRELADLGDEDAHEHLKRLGIDRKQEKKEEEAARNSDGSTRPLSPDDKSNALVALKGAVNAKIFQHLHGHQTSPFYTNLQKRGITIDSIMAPIREQNTLKGMLEELHRQMSVIDSAHNGLRSANEQVRTAGGYGNIGYNEAISRLERGGLVPSGMSQVHQRAVTGRHTIPRFSEVEEQNRAREEAERVRRQEEQRREESIYAESWQAQKKNVGDMISHIGGSRNYSESDKKKMAYGIQKSLGKDFNFEKWLADVQHTDNRIETKIKLNLNDFIQIGSNRDSYPTVTMNFEYIIKERESGEIICTPSRTIGKNRDGSLYIHNGVFPRIPDRFKTKYKNVATAIYTGSENCVREMSKNLSAAVKKKCFVDIGTCANSGFAENGYKGAIVWAKHRYDWKEPDSTKAMWKDRYKRTLASNASTLGLSNEDVQNLNSKIDSCEYPYQFMYLGVGLQPAQMGRDIDADIRKEVAKNGSYDIGCWLMQKIGMSWSAVNYVNQTEGRGGHLNENRKEYRERLAERRAATTTAKPRRTRTRRSPAQ